MGIRSIAAVALCSVLFPQSSNASTILFETAAGAPTSVGAILGDSNWHGHAFEIIEAVGLESIGGQVNNDTGSPLTLFGAVVALTSQFDLPDSIDLTPYASVPEKPR